MYVYGIFDLRIILMQTPELHAAAWKTLKVNFWLVYIVYVALQFCPGIWTSKYIKGILQSIDNSLL